MLFSYTWLQEHVSGKFPLADKLEELLNMRVFEVEGKERKGKDWVFDVNVLSHRGDALGHRGLAREIAVLLGTRLTKPPRTSLKAAKGTLEPVRLKVQSPAVLRYSAVVLEGVRIGKSPQWLRERLESLGVNSINNVVDVTNYVMAELGQPLHAFDYDTLREHRMTVREAREGESVETLDDLTLKLPKGALVIEDKGRLIDLAGIKGGKQSGIGANTRNVVLQAATFGGPRIYKTKKQLGYTTPAADMYAHGLDPSMTLEALERAAELLGKTGAAKIVQVLDAYPKPRNPRTLLFDSGFLEKLLGAAIPQSTAVRLLERLGFQVEAAKKGTLRVVIPTFRQDIVLPQDLVEEVGRLYGYEKIKPSFPVASLTPSGEDPLVRLEERLQNALAEAGYTETYSYSFVGEKDLETFAYTPKDKDALVRLKNPYSEEYKYLRPNLAENLLKFAEENAKRPVPEAIRIFEIGKAFGKAKGRVEERHLVSGLIFTPGKDSQALFAEVKGVVDFVLSRLGVPGVWYDSFQATPLHARASLWHPKQTAEAKIGDREVGFLGAVSPKIAGNLKLRGSAAVFSLDVAEVLARVAEEKEYRPIPRFPAAYRDLAVLVPRTAKVADVMNVIYSAGGELLEDADLFDMYEGDRIPEGLKNLAFHLVYQSYEKTLRASEVDSLQEKITKALEDNPAWEVRT